MISKEAKGTVSPTSAFLIWSCLTSLLGSAIHTTFQKKKAFLFHAGSLVNISHIVNPSNTADPQTSWRKRQQWPGSSRWGLQGYPHAPLSQRPSGHTLELSTRSVCTFSLTSKTYSATPGLSPCLFIGVGYSGQSDSQRLGFPWQKGAGAVAVYARLHRMTWQPSALPSCHTAELWLQAPRRPGYVPRHALLSAPPW